MSGKWNQKDVCMWIAKVANDPKVKNMGHLKDGIVLCNFMNQIIPGSCKGVNKSGYTSEHRKNLEKVANALKAYGVKNLFVSDDVFSFAKRDRVVKSFIEFDSLLRSDRDWSGPYITKIQKKATGAGLTLLESKQQQVAKKNVKFDRVRHGVIQNVDEERDIYATYDDHE